MPKKSKSSSKKHKHSRYKPPTSSDEMQANNEVILNQISQLEKQLQQQGMKDSLSELQHEIDMMRTTINEEDEEESLHYTISDFPYLGSTVENPRSYCNKQVNLAFLSEEYLQRIRKNLSGVRFFVSVSLFLHYFTILILLLVSAASKQISSENTRPHKNDLNVDKSKLLSYYAPVIGFITFILVFRIATLYYLTMNNMKKYSFQASGMHMTSWLVWILFLLFSLGAFFVVLFMAMIANSAPAYIALIFLTLWSLHRPYHQQVDFALHLCSYDSAFQRFYRSLLPALFLIYPRPLPRFSPRAGIQLYLSFYLDKQYPHVHSSEEAPNAGIVNNAEDEAEVEEL